MSTRRRRSLQGSENQGEIRREIQEGRADTRPLTSTPFEIVPAVAPGAAPSDPADPPATRVDRGNALFSSLKSNRGERIRTFDFLVPNQAL